MNNDLQIFETEALTASEKTELGKNIDRLVNVHKNNRQEINRLVFDSIAAMTEAGDAATLLARKGTLSRWIGGVSGTNQRLQNTINKNRSVAQYAIQQILRKLAEQNAMSLDLITAVNIKLNASLNNIEDDVNDVYAQLTIIKEGLKKFFRHNRNELMRIEGQLHEIKKDVRQAKQDVKLLKWQNSIEYQDFNGIEYENLDDATKIVCLARDFYEITGGNWSDSDLLLLKTAMSSINMQPRREIKYFTVIEKIANDKALQDKFLGSGELLPCKDPGYLITMGALKKMEAYQNEERNNVTALAKFLTEKGKDYSLGQIRAYLTKEYMKDSVSVDPDTNVECYDLVIDLLFNLKEAKSVGLLVNDKIGPVTAEELMQEADKYYENKDYERAFELNLTSAEMGLSWAQYNVAVMYKNGEGVYQDTKEAFKWYSKAAEQGLAEAQYALAIMYGTGEGTYQDSIKAYEWCRKAAEQDNADAQFSLGGLFYDGEGVKQDFSKAFEWFKKAARKGHADAQYHLASMFSLGKGTYQDDEKAFEWYHMAAEQGSADAQFMLGVMYKEGDGIRKDSVEAFKWFMKAAQQGNDLAQLNIGKLYFSGDGIIQNKVKAHEWFMKAAEQGSASAQYCLSAMYYSGDGKEQDYTKAAEWCLRAAEQEFAPAQYLLGQMYFLGNGVQQNRITAYDWYKKAANQGLAEAQYNLGLGYYYGDVFNQDKNKGLMLIHMAAEQGLDEAKGFLKELGYAD